MAIMYLSKYELLTLSMYSRTKPEGVSPLMRLYIDQALNMNKKKLEEAANEMLKSNYVIKNEKGFFLARELEPAFFILHKPERLIAFKRLSMPEVYEIYFTVRKGFAIQYTVRNDELFETLIYPFTMKGIKNWYKEDLLKGVTFNSDTLPQIEIQLTIDETILLFTIINIYRNRVMNLNRGLTPAETWISLEEIRNFRLTQESELKGLISMLLTKENIENYLSGNVNLENVIQLLIAKGLIKREQDRVSYSEKGKAVFDPGKVKDAVIIKDYLGKKGVLSSVNILNDGYMLFKPNKNGLDYCIKTFPYFTDKEFLLDIVLEQNRQTEEPNLNKDVNLSEKVERYCAECGNPISPGAVFCSNCGFRV